MNGALRVRIIALQALLVLVLGFASGFALYEGNFVNSFVHDQLASQKITFPAASTEVPGGALDPAVFPASIRQYAGQQLVNGDQAYQYANNFIAVHLSKIGGGKAYAQFPSTGLTPAQTATKATLFQGESLRAMLLNAWGWSQVAKYTVMAGIGLAIAAGLVLVALAFEVTLAVRSREQSPARKVVTAQSH